MKPYRTAVVAAFGATQRDALAHLAAAVWADPEREPDLNTLTIDQASTAEGDVLWRLQVECR